MPPMMYGFVYNGQEESGDLSPAVCAGRDLLQDIGKRTRRKLEGLRRRARVSIEAAGSSAEPAAQGKSAARTE